MQRFYNTVDLSCNFYNKTQFFKAYHAYWRYRLNGHMAYYTAVSCQNTFLLPPCPKRGRDQNRNIILAGYSALQGTSKSYITCFLSHIQMQREMSNQLNSSPNENNFISYSLLKPNKINVQGTADEGERQHRTIIARIKIIWQNVWK